MLIHLFPATRTAIITTEAGYVNTVARAIEAVEDARARLGTKLSDRMQRKRLDDVLAALCRIRALCERCALPDGNVALPEAEGAEWLRLSAELDKAKARAKTSVNLSTAPPAGSA